MTPFTTSVPIDDVLQTAISLVQKAEKKVVASQSPFDESKVQPTDEYFNSVEKAINRGVKFSRYCFGREPIEEIDARGVHQFYAGSQEYYQRVLIIDDTTAMFKVGENFYYTEFQPLVVALTMYVTQGRDVREISSTVYKNTSKL